MYAALWRVLPGPWWVRLMIVMVLMIAVLAVLAEWVFPSVQSLVLDRNITVGS
ncbi:hypothetical protein [Rathayibacter toxicus]|uniref:Membrane protein n=1 Tax=Rathayibacter toxicus TaxID=145458 RepID=A0A0C5BD48_9MICO|nr:hypothetical protein [Rathayibacter toxicus]AJM76914.1 membrane protein [Rathayibacter toxicus]KKM45720.1 membrane protein [Rathayibacter toxicus]QOD08336.1 hypothetical protein AYW78_00080 [Rathayibacter toxicus]QOD10452.1 hypothetical protein BSG36_00080 [Rathayibacter toxicus]